MSLKPEVVRRNDLLQELKSCSSLQRGKEIHARAAKSKADSCVYLATGLVRMYAKCGDMAAARKVFDNMKQPDVVSWTALIAGYAANGEGITALDLYARMKYLGCLPNSFTFVAALKACASLAQEQNASEWLQRGKEMHSEVGCHLNIHVLNTVVDMYAKLGSMVEARRTFDEIAHPNVVSWTVVILGYVENGEADTALETFSFMRLQGCSPDSLSFIAALKACTYLSLTRRAKALEWGKKLHLQIGWNSDIKVQNALLNMYAKCSSMVKARQVFDGMKAPDVVAWTVLILGYADNGNASTALQMFARMSTQGLTPGSSTFVAALKACGLLGALEYGKRIHAEVDRTGTGNVILVNSLVDFYAKCGSMVEAHKVFDSHHSTRNVITWNALLAGYSRLGDCEVVFELFREMQDASFEPDGVTLLCVLTCCRHAGLLDKANELLEAMSSKYGMIPRLEHYTCLVGILCSLNKLDGAVALLQRMPCKADAVIWMTVLDASSKWKDVKTGKLAFGCVLSLDNTHAAAYVTMANIYRSRGMWKEQQMVLAVSKELTAWREPGQTSWMDSEGQVQTFLG